MTSIEITANDNAQQKIDSSRVGDRLIFSGTFHLEEPLIFWTNRDYSGSASTFYVKRVGIECRDRPGERSNVNPLALWLDQRLQPSATLPDVEYDEDEDEEHIHFPEPSLMQRLGWWMKRQLRSVVRFVFWFPRGGIITGFTISGELQEGQYSAIRMRTEQS